MATQFCIAAPSLLINGTPLPIVANSLSVTDGNGSTVVDTQSFGGDIVQLTVSQDVSGLYSILKFKVRSTIENITLIRTFKELIGDLFIQLTDEKRSFSGSMRDASIVNKLEFMFSASGEVDVEIHGTTIQF